MCVVVVLSVLIVLSVCVCAESLVCVCLVLSVCGRGRGSSMRECAFALRRTTMPWNTRACMLSASCALVCFSVLSAWCVLFA